MKKTVFAVIAAILLLAAGCKTNASGNEANPQTENDARENIEKTGELSIAYISMDSMMVKFDMANELSEQMQAKMKKAESQINSKGSKLEREFADYQEKASKGLLTRSQMAEIEEGLSMQQQQLMTLRDKLSNEIAEEQEVMTNRINYFINEFLEEFNADYKYDMIMSTYSVGPILHAHPRLDITKEVIDGLNAKYIKEKEAEQKKK